MKFTITTEQILHPERYPQEQPITVLLPDILPSLGEDWYELDSGVMGEWYHVLILSYAKDPFARVEEGIAQKAAEGWGGDAYLLLVNDKEQNAVFILRTVWDSLEDAEEFEKNFRIIADARFGAPIATQPGITSWNSSQGYSEFHRKDEMTTWIIAPDSTTASMIWNALKGQ